jgi:hypothetical protein
MDAVTRASHRWTFAFCCWAALAGGLTSQPAAAALGQDVASVEADRQHMKGQVRPTAVAGYSVQEIQTSTNTVIREYVSAAGTIFAVSWRGPVMPDLQQILGSYFEQYRTAARAPHAGHRHLAIEQPGLVLHSNGQMRAFYGKAYVPGLLPANFSPGDIQ